MKMPVKFQKSSEYKESFYPHQSIKSASFVPAPEQAMRTAGVGSKYIGASLEPSIQRKRPSKGPPTTFSSDFFLEGAKQDEYALLGNQDKFAKSIKYRTKNNNATRDVSPPKQQKLHTKQIQNTEAPVVNTDEFKQPPTPLAPRDMKDGSKNRGEEKKYKDSEKQKYAKETRKEPEKSEYLKRLDSHYIRSEAPAVNTEKFKEPVTPLAPRKVKDFEAQLKNKGEVVKSQLKEIEKRKKSKEARKESEKEEYLKGKDAYNQRLMKIKEAPVVNTEEYRKPHESYKSKTMPVTEHMLKESPQKDKKSNYALKYKAGIVPPRQSKKISEYHKQFTWKENIPSSPIIAAEEVVYKSNSQLKPYKTDVIPKVTEYNAQFKAHDDDKIMQQVIAEEKRNRKQRMKARSKSVGAAPRIRPAGSSPVVTPDNRRLTKESDVVAVGPAKVEESHAVPKVPQHHGKMRKVQTEYKSNFKSPMKFSYDKGAWQGADPPHIYQSKEIEQPKVEKPTSWFAEVVELRQKAEEYRKRAQGTHFSREHLVQVMAKQADLWDVESTCSTLSARSLESRSTVTLKERIMKEKRSDYGSNKATIATEVPEAWANDVESPDDDDYTPRESCTEASERLSSNRTLETTDDEGRKPTPKLRNTSKTRHHFDRTTPVTGGALLSSPQINKQSPKRATVSKSLPNFSSVREVDQAEEEVRAYKPLAGQHAKMQTYVVEDNKRPFTTPTLGMPTRDYQPLRDDDASIDRPLSTHYVHSPLKTSVLERTKTPDIPAYKTNFAAVKKSKNRPDYIPGTIQEHMGETYTKLHSDLKDQQKERTRAWNYDDVYAYDDDDDVLSVSARSVASSCSLASEVLERARKRKEEFWDRGNIASR